MTAAATEGTSTRKAPGRKTQGVEEVIRLETLKTREDDLIALHKKAAAAQVELDEAVKETARETGLLATTVNKYIKARASDNFDERKKKVMQLALVFEDGPKS